MEPTDSQTPSFSERPVSQKDKVMEVIVLALFAVILIAFFLKILFF